MTVPAAALKEGSMTAEMLAPSSNPSDITATLALSPVIPVVTIQREADAVPLSEALLRGGISIIEVTLRSAAALGAIEAIRKDCPTMCVGAGTLWTAEQTLQAASAGAEFIVSPGIADAVQDVTRSLKLPYLPGAQTASEVAHLVRRGLKATKFFPAGPAGGPAAVAALSDVFPDVAFCPTGGVGATTAPAYLKLSCVPCVSGSWLTTGPLLAERNWKAVQELAQRASQLANYKP
jgi:2-dehydro-3-deoxyphosphogluconate aldolase/(4S)-4-hydroxy-2-oxoglutarate aldolase